MMPSVLFHMEWVINFLGCATKRPNVVHTRTAVALISLRSHTARSEPSLLFHMSCNVRKRTVGKIQISPHFPAVRSEFSLGIFWIAEDAKCLHADNEERSVDILI